MGGEGLGSTSGSLSGGSGGPPSIGSSSSSGRGGGGEFSLVLQKVAPSGSIVKKGDVVAEFDRESMLTRLNDYEASVMQSEASFKKMKADLAITKKAHEQSILAAKGEFEKAQLNLKTTPVMSAIETERIRLALEEAEARYKQLLKEVQYVEAGIKADLRVAEIELEQSKVELRRAEMNANRMLMTAPIDGLVVMQNTFRGSEFDQVKQGDQLFPGQPFMQIVDTSSMVVNAVVNQLDVEKIRIGQRAHVRFDAFPDLVLPARVSGVGSVGKSSRYRPDFLKEMSVLLKLDKLDPRVIPDLSVSCDIILEREEASAIVPREAVYLEQAAAGAQRAGAYVLVQRGKEWIKRPVELGLENFVSVAVKSGLKPGEVIALEKPAAAVKT
jgi:multidrug efflux pump subunit AcrA (membrane-fusion protein)